MNPFGSPSQNDVPGVGDTFHSRARSLAGTLRRLSNMPGKTAGSRLPVSSWETYA